MQGCRVDGVREARRAETGVALVVELHNIDSTVASAGRYIGRAVVAMKDSPLAENGVEA